MTREYAVLMDNQRNLSVSKNEFTLTGEDDDALFKYLADFQNKNEIVKSDTALAVLKLICSGFVNSKTVDRFISLSFEYDFCSILLNILRNEQQTLKNEIDLINNNYLENKQLFNFSYVCLIITRCFSNSSAKFCNYFVESNGIGLLVNYLQIEPLLKAYIELNDEVYNKSAKKKKEDEANLKPKKYLYDVLENIVRGSIGSLLNLSRVYHNTKQKWKKAQLNLMGFFQALSEKLKNTNDCTMAIYMIIASISDDQEINDYSEDLKKAIFSIVSLVKKISKLFESENKSSLKRMSIELSDSDNEPKEIATIRCDNKRTIWHLVELLNALYNLAVCDQIKQDIYEVQNMSEYLRTFIYNGNETEAEYSLRLLWQLCFDKKIAEHCRNDAVLVEKVKHLETNSASFSLKRNCEGFLWQLNRHSTTPIQVEKETKFQIAKISNEKKRKNSEQRFFSECPGYCVPYKPLELAKEDDYKPNNQKHIMISYNSESRDLCLKIKNELEKEGLRIWIDVESIHGSSLGSMAEAIENSICVLVCMTEKYKQSNNCRTEAEYAFQIGKPIVPLIMQKNYKPDGW